MKWLLVGSAWLFVVATAQDEIDLLIQSVFNTTDLPPFGGGGDGGGVSAGSGGGTVIGGGNGNGGIGNGGNGNGGNGNGGFGGGGGTIGGGGGATDGGGGAIGGGGCGGGGGGGGAVGGGGFGGNEGPIDGIPPIPPSATDNYVPEGVDPAEDCACVSFYLCPNNSVITDGSGLLDIRRPEICDSYMDVCCKVPPVEVPITPPPMGHRGCGTRNPDGIGFRITGNLDHEAQYGEFPWMIAVLRSEELSDGTVLKVYHCGGALIHRNVVLTAAHCVHGKNPSILKVRAGEWDTQTKKEMFPHQDRDVARVIVHEQYYAGALYNDVALLIVSEPFNYDDNVDIVCLPTQNDVVLSKNCFASGWGKDVFGKEGKYQVILKKIELPMVARKPCVDALRKTRLGPYFRLHESFVCAGGEPGKDTCKGDGGSPLVCPVPGQDFKYQQVGIVAWGIGCGQETPAVYVHVAHFRNWIDQNMRRLNFDYEYNY